MRLLARGSIKDGRDLFFSPFSLFSYSFFLRIVSFTRPDSLSFSSIRECIIIAQREIIIIFFYIVYMYRYKRSRIILSTHDECRCWWRRNMSVGINFVYTHRIYYSAASNFSFDPIFELRRTAGRIQCLCLPCIHKNGLPKLVPAMSLAKKKEIIK